MVDLYGRIPGTKNFRWIEFLKLRQWGFSVFPTDLEQLNIVRTAKKLQAIRDLLGFAIGVTSGIRPGPYNKHIGGSDKSLHRTGEAVDFVVAGYTGAEGCDKIRSILEPRLETFGIRMENKPGSTWIHIDTAPPGASGRFFTP